MHSYKVREVVASSTGNHGAALAYAARHLGVPATIFLPANPNPVKAERIQRLGATLVESGIDSAAAARAARQHAQHTGAYFLDDASDANVPAGTATIAMEILDQLPEVNEICVPVGDTALIRGIATAVRQRRPEVRIIGVQAERAPSYYLSWRSGHAVETDDCNTIADGLATRTPVESNVQSIRELVDEMVLVGDQDMLRAIHHLLLREHIVAEPAGAATTAALLCATWKPRRGPAVAIVSGANIAPDVLRKAVIGC
jgi:threonine dehydratase